MLEEIVTKKCERGEQCNPKISSHNCYVLKDIAKCSERSCSPCTGFETSSDCYKKTGCARCPGIETADDGDCCTETLKDCSDYGYVLPSMWPQECGGGAISQCSKEVTIPGCEAIGKCYECKTCADHGYQASSSCPPGKVAQPANICKLKCFQCVPATCDCTDFEVENTEPKETECAIGEAVYPWYKDPSSPCYDKKCWYSRCKNCGDWDQETTKPERPSCKKVVLDTHCQADSGSGCPPLFCWKIEDFVCDDFTDVGTGDGGNCAKSSSECSQAEYYKDGACPGPFPDPDTKENCNLSCNGYCKPYCGWKVTNYSGAQNAESCCKTVFTGSKSSNCIAGSSTYVAENGVSGFFSVTCTCTGKGTRCENVCKDPPDGCGPNGQPVPGTAWPPGCFGGGGFQSPTTTVVCGFEDCGFSPIDYTVTVSLERCKECA